MATRAERLLCAAVTVAVTVTMVSGHSADSCGVRGCTITGGCRNPTEVTCDFQDDPDKEITFVMRNLTKSIQEITIFNVKKMQVTGDFIKSYDNLERIVFGNISEVKLMKDSLARRAQLRPLSVTIENVTHLHLHDNAITEWQHPHGQISIRNVESCIIDWSAFSKSAEVENVLFENIASLEAKTGAFKANITRLTLKNASFNCFYNTFSGPIGTLTLQSLEIKEMVTGCVVARGWGSLNLISCRLPLIKYRAFQGIVHNVSIESTSVGCVDRAGFNMKVSSLFVRASTFDDLAEDALSVFANKSIILQQNNVTALRANAFRLLRTSQSDKLFNITQLVVRHAYYGSFRFIKDTKVILHDLSLHVHCECDVRRLAQRLVFGHEIPPRDITAEAERVLLEPFQRSRCLFENSTLTMAEFLRQQCIVEESETARPVSAEEDADPSSTSDDTSDRRSDEESGNGVISSYAAIAAVVLLFVLIVVTVVIRRRSRAGRGFLLCGKTLPGGVNRAENNLHVSRTSTSAAAEEDYMYCEVNLPTDHPMDGEAVVFSNSAACGEAPHEVAAIMEAEEEPLYEEISAEGCTEMNQGMVGYEAFGSSQTTAANTLDQSDTRTGHPVYAEVVKKKPKTKNLGSTDKVSSAEELPLYAQIVKGKSAANDSKRNHEAVTIADVPVVYAQVSKKKCSTRANGTGHRSTSREDLSRYGGTPKNKAPKESEASHQKGIRWLASVATGVLPTHAETSSNKPTTSIPESCHQYDASDEEPPVYAVVSKSKRSTNRPEAGPPSVVSSKQPPFCLTISKNELANNNSKDDRRPEVPDQTLPVYSVVTKDKCATENQREDVQPGSTSHPAEDALYSEVEAIEDIPLYAEVSADIKDNVQRQTDEDLFDNPLYESRMF